MAEGSTRDTYKTFRLLTTRWLDNNLYGHMNNVVLYSLFDSAVSGWLIEAGVLDIHGGEQIGLVVVTGCRYWGGEPSFRMWCMPAFSLRSSAHRPSATKSACSAMTKGERPRPNASLCMLMWTAKRPGRKPLNDPLRNALQSILA